MASVPVLKSGWSQPVISSSPASELGSAPPPLGSFDTPAYNEGAIVEENLTLI